MPSANASAPAIASATYAPCVPSAPSTRTIGNVNGGFANARSRCAYALSPASSSAPARTKQ